MWVLLEMLSLQRWQLTCNGCQPGSGGSGGGDHGTKTKKMASAPAAAGECDKMAAGALLLRQLLQWLYRLPLIRLLLRQLLWRLQWQLPAAEAAATSATAADELAGGCCCSPCSCCHRAAAAAASAGSGVGVGSVLARGLNSQMGGGTWRLPWASHLACPACQQQSLSSPASPAPTCHLSSSDHRSHLPR